MDENPTELVAEFQKLRQETSGLSQNLMANTRSDAHRSFCSNINNVVLKVMIENFEAIRIGSDSGKKKQEENYENQNQLMKELLDELRAARIEHSEIKTQQKEDSETNSSKKQVEELKDQMNVQNEMMKEVLEELRVVRMEIAEIKKHQEEDRKEMENIKTVTNQIQETLKNSKIVELCGYWTLTQEQPSSLPFPLMYGKQHFHEEDNMLTWSICQNELLSNVTNVRVGSDECKVKEDGKIEITIFFSKFELEVKENLLTIGYKDTKVVFERSS